MVNRLQTVTQCQFQTVPGCSSSINLSLISVHLVLYYSTLPHQPHKQLDFEAWVLRLSQVLPIDVAKVVVVWKLLYRYRLKSLYMVAWYFFLLLLKCYGWSCLGPAQQNLHTFKPISAEGTGMAAMHSCGLMKCQWEIPVWSVHSFTAFSQLVTAGHILVITGNTWSQYLATPSHTWQHLVTTKGQHSDPNGGLSTLASPIQFKFPALSWAKPPYNLRKASKMASEDTTDLRTTCYSYYDHVSMPGE